MLKALAFKGHDAIYFTFSYLVAAMLLFWSMGNAEFLIYSGVILAVALGVWICHMRVGLSRGVLWNLSILGFMHLMGGLLHIPDVFPVGGPKAVLYNLWVIPDMVRYDHVIHSYGYGTVTWLCWQALKHLFPSAKPTPAPLSICLLAGMGLGALNEIVEFFAVNLGIETNVGGYVDTGWDLIANFMGSLVALVIILLYHKDGESRVEDPR